MLFCLEFLFLHFAVVEEKNSREHDVMGSGYTGAEWGNGGC